MSRDAARRKLLADLLAEADADELAHAGVLLVRRLDELHKVDPFGAARVARAIREPEPERPQTQVEPPWQMVGVSTIKWNVQCPACYGLGFYDDRGVQRYCSCRAGFWRGVRDGVEAPYGGLTRRAG